MNIIWYLYIEFAPQRHITAFSKSLDYYVGTQEGATHLFKSYPKVLSILLDCLTDKKLNSPAALSILKLQDHDSRRTCKYDF